MTLSIVFCRRTRKEAEEYYRYVVDNADEGAITISFALCLLPLSPSRKPHSKAYANVLQLATGWYAG